MACLPVSGHDLAIYIRVSDIFGCERFDIQHLNKVNQRCSLCIGVGKAFHCDRRRIFLGSRKKTFFEFREINSLVCILRFTWAGRNLLKLAFIRIEDPEVGVAFTGTIIQEEVLSFLNSRRHSIPRRQSLCFPVVEVNTGKAAFR